MPTPSSKPACKTCGKPGFKDAAGVMQHERRADATVFGGRRATPEIEKEKAEPLPEQAPKREHLLHREVFGRKPAA